MNLLFSCIGQRGYIAEFFRRHLRGSDRIIGTGNNRWTPGFSQCDAAFILPDINSPAYLGAVLALCREQHIDAVLSFNDLDVFALSKAHDQFAHIGTRLILPSAEVAEVAYDKYLTFEFLTKLGIPTPRTALAPTHAANFSYPLYVKPRRGSGSMNTFLASNPAEMLCFYNYRPDMIIQEAIRGEPINIDLCGDFAGNPVGVAMWRKLRSRLGETERAETFHDDQVLDFALAFGRQLRATGPVDIDAFLATEGIVVLEANTRFGGGYPVSELAGADFPRLIIELVQVGKVEPVFSFRAGIAMMKRLEILGGSTETLFQETLNISE